MVMRLLLWSGDYTQLYGRIKFSKIYSYVSMRVQLLQDELFKVDITSSRYGVQGVDTVSATTDAANKAYVDTTAGAYLPLAGGTMTGNIVMGDNDFTGIDQLLFTSGTFLTDVSSNYVKLHYASTAAAGMHYF